VLKIISLVGARPEFIQSVPVSQALRRAHREILVHTGQHYDYAMSQAFFDELGIPAPDYNLEVGSGAHSRQTAEILVRLDDVLQAEQPDLIVVRGDTNSTVAGALAASKRHIPVVHVEAGERSFDRRMPEEVNRLVCDSLADLHCCVSGVAVANLAAEGITASAHWVGDVMLDALLLNLPRARRASTLVQRLGVRPGRYTLVTVHRAANTDDPARLARLVAALNGLPEPIVFPAHPRTRRALAALGLTFEPHVRLLEPAGYFDMLALEENASLIATDSGGVQREAYYLGRPCLTLRDETEWSETVLTGWNRLVGVDPERIRAEWFDFAPPAARPPIYGDGTAGERIAGLIDRAPVTYGAPRRAVPAAPRAAVAPVLEVLQ
jgi:UDP-GlcNAc3NAcA epimerase